MKTVGLLLSATLLAVVPSAGTESDAAKDADGAPPPLSSLCEGDLMLERLPPALNGKPFGDNGVVVPPERAQRARAYGCRRGPDYKMRIIRPKRGIDYKIVQIGPDPNVDYKIRILCPGGYHTYAVPPADNRRGIIIAPKRGGRGE